MRLTAPGGARVALWACWRRWAGGESQSVPGRGGLGPATTPSRAPSGAAADGWRKDHARSSSAPRTGAHHSGCSHAWPGPCRGAGGPGLPMGDQRSRARDHGLGQHDLHRRRVHPDRTPDRWWRPHRPRDRRRTEAPADHRPGERDRSGRRGWLVSGRILHLCRGRAAHEPRPDHGGRRSYCLVSRHRRFTVWRSEARRCTCAGDSPA